MRRNERGFTLIELLIVVAIIGIIAGIAIPNLLNAVDRTKQKRTMTDIKALGQAVEQYMLDWNYYPTASDIGGLDPSVAPHYIKKMPSKDGWNHDLIYTPSSGLGYTIGSGGKDGGALTVVGSGGPTTDFDDAIIFVDGQFVQWPDGQQR
jgi:general secretion pathway protein G